MKKTHLLTLLGCCCGGAFCGYVLAEFFKLEYRLPESLMLVALGVLAQWIFLKKERSLGAAATLGGILTAAQTGLLMILSHSGRPLFTALYLVLEFGMLQYLAVAALCGKEGLNPRVYCDAFTLILLMYTVPRWSAPLQGQSWVILPMAVLMLAGMAVEGGGNALRPLPALAAGTAAVGGAALVSLLVASVVSDGVSAAVRRLLATLVSVLKAVGRALEAFLVWLFSLFPEPEVDMELPEPEEGLAIPAGAAEEFTVNLGPALAALMILLVLGALFLLWRLRRVRLGDSGGRTAGRPVIIRRKSRRASRWQAFLDRLRLRLAWFRCRRTPEGVLRRTERLLAKAGRPRRPGESFRAFLARCDPEGLLAPVLRALELRSYAARTEGTPSPRECAGLFRAYRRRFQKAERARKRALKKEQAKKPVPTPEIS